MKTLPPDWKNKPHARKTCSISIEGLKLVYMQLKQLSYGQFPPYPYHYNKHQMTVIWYFKNNRPEKFMVYCSWVFGQKAGLLSDVLQCNCGLSEKS